MPSSPIIINGVPSNIRLPEGSRATHVESDLYAISERLRELDGDLFLAMLETPSGEVGWAVCETDRQGTEALIFRVGPGCEIDELDGRVIKKLNYLRSVPLKERIARLEKEIDRERAAAHADKIDGMYESFGGDLYDALFRCGFVHDQRPESVRKLNATAKRAGRRI